LTVLHWIVLCSIVRWIVLYSIVRWIVLYSIVRWIVLCSIDGGFATSEAAELPSVHWIILNSIVHSAMDVLARTTLYVDPMLATGADVAYPASVKCFKRIQEPIFRTVQLDVSTCPDVLPMHKITVPIQLQRVRPNIFNRYVTSKPLKRQTHYCSGTLVHLENWCFRGDVLSQCRQRDT
jgi:hypothetical protein